MGTLRLIKMGRRIWSGCYHPGGQIIFNGGPIQSNVGSERLNPSPNNALGWIPCGGGHLGGGRLAKCAGCYFKFFCAIP